LAEKYPYQNFTQSHNISGELGFFASSSDLCVILLVLDVLFTLLLWTFLFYFAHPSCSTIGLEYTFPERKFWQL